MHWKVELICDSKLLSRLTTTLGEVRKERMERRAERKETDKEEGLEELKEGTREGEETKAIWKGSIVGRRESSYKVLNILSLDNSSVFSVCLTF